MAIDRLQVTFSGGTMGTGVATHYARPGAGLQPAFKAFWTDVNNIMSGYVTLYVPNVGETFDEETGELVGTWSEGTTYTSAGGGSGGYAGGVGACVGWGTSGIHAGRKVRGRTFVCPLAGNQYDTDGSLVSGALSRINGAAITLLAAADGDAVIWSRPRPGLAGAAYSINAGVVKDHVSWLRSRR